MHPAMQGHDHRIESGDGHSNTALVETGYGILRGPHRNPHRQDSPGNGRLVAPAENLLNVSDLGRDPRQQAVKERLRPRRPARMRQLSVAKLEGFGRQRCLPVLGGQRRQLDLQVGDRLVRTDHEPSRGDAPRRSVSNGAQFQTCTPGACTPRLGRMPAGVSAVREMARSPT